MSELPRGTVTFLFTDIEGSTKLWQQFPNAMPDALARHHEILQRAIESHNGYVFQIIGDAFCAAFATALDGLDAALAAQRALRDFAWGETGAIRVRMALHTGAAEVRAGEFTSGEYVSGITLSRAARLLSAGHGGQILVSQATYDALNDRLPDQVSLRDMGERRLKDLIRPERIYQILCDDLVANFPPLKSLDARPNNLPVQLSLFVGRESEIQSVMAQLREIRLVSLVGPGGVGKTRLALQIAANIIDEYENGVWFVPFASLQDPLLAPAAIASALQIREQPGRPIQETLTEYLRGKNLLLVLDNCEHLIQPLAQLAEELLHMAPRVSIIATSQETLNVEGEHVHRVAPLSLPAWGSSSAMEGFVQSEAVRLFALRAHALQPSFVLNSENIEIVSQICSHLDGIPLAIELAAARVRVLSVSQIAARLQDRFQLLTGGSRTAEQRQQTLRAAIDWSHHLLDETQRILFRRLAVFNGGCTLEAAERVCADQKLEAGRILDELTHLLDKSLLVVAEMEHEPRYTMLESIRAYATLKLIEAEEYVNVQNQHLAYFLLVARLADSKLQGDEESIWLNVLQDNHHNLRAALEWAERSGNIQSNLELAGSLWWFWNLKGYFAEGARQLERSAAQDPFGHYPLALANVLAGSGAFAWLRGDYEFAQFLLARSSELARTQGPAANLVLAWALYWQSITMMRTGKTAQAKGLAHESEQLYRALGIESGLALTLFGSGRIALEFGDTETAHQLSKESYEIARNLKFDYGTSLALSSLGQIALQRGELASARSFFHERMEIATQANDKWAVGNLKTNLAEIDQIQQQYTDAAMNYQTSLDIARELENTGDIARRLCCLAIVEYHLGNQSAARLHLAESMALFRAQHFTRGIAECLMGLAILSAAENPQAASVLLRASDNLFEQMGAKRWTADQIEYQRLVTKLGYAYNNQCRQPDHSALMELTMEQAIELALREETANG